MEQIYTQQFDETNNQIRHLRRESNSLQRAIYNVRYNRGPEPLRPQHWRIINMYRNMYQEINRQINDLQASNTQLQNNLYILIDSRPEIFSPIINNRTPNRSTARSNLNTRYNYTTYTSSNNMDTSNNNIDTSNAFINNRNVNLNTIYNSFCR